MKQRIIALLLMTLLTGGTLTGSEALAESRDEGKAVDAEVKPLPFQNTTFRLQHALADDVVRELSRGLRDSMGEGIRAIYSDTRTNSVVVIAAPKVLKYAENRISDLDVASHEKVVDEAADFVPPENAVDEAAGDVLPENVMVDRDTNSVKTGNRDTKTRATLAAYEIKTVDPDTVLRVLRTIVADQPGVRLDLDPKTSKIIVLAREAEHLIIKDAIRVIEGSEPNARQNLPKPADDKKDLLGLQFGVSGSPKQPSSKGRDAAKEATESLLKSLNSLHRHGFIQPRVDASQVRNEIETLTKLGFDDELLLRLISDPGKLESSIDALAVILGVVLNDSDPEPDMRPKSPDPAVRPENKGR